MSATNRNGSERRTQDHYVTAPWTVHRFLEAYKIPQGATVLDPCAANGELLAAIKHVRPDLTLLAFELREECRGPLDTLVAAGVLAGALIGDFFELAKSLSDSEVDYVVTNPPYSLAQPFIDETIRIARVSASHLLRVNFLGSGERRDWVAATLPGLKISPNRPSFTGWGGDACEYAWFVFGDDSVAGTWEVLALTPDEVISEWNARARAMFPEENPKLKKAARAAKAAVEDAESTAG